MIVPFGSAMFPLYDASRRRQIMHKPILSLPIPGGDGDTSAKWTSEFVAGLKDNVTEQDQLELRYGQVPNRNSLGQNPAEEKSERSENEGERELHLVAVDVWRLLE